MPPYDSNPQIIRKSLEELMFILNWVRERGGTADAPVTVLVGGWAVDAYNPYYGSVDIDIVTNSKTKGSLKYILTQEHGYNHYRDSGINTVYKPTEYGDIIIDFGNRDEIYKFEGRDDELNFDLLDEHTIIKNVRGNIPAYVPTRSLLLLYKLKAAWDRSYRLDAGTSPDFEWEISKIIKDFADVLALIDPDHGGNELDLNFLGEKLHEYYFLRDILETVSNNQDGLQKYGKMSLDSARENIQRLLSLTSR